MSYCLTDELLERGHDLRVWLDLEEGVLGHTKDEEVTLVRMEFGDRSVFVVGLDELPASVNE